MGKRHSFKFLDDDLNRRLLDLMAKAGVGHSIDREGVVHYSAEDEEIVGNDLIGSVRDEVFPSWQVLTCPNDWVAIYKGYMRRRGIPFREERANGEPWLLLPGKYRPHSWKLDGPTRKRRKESPRIN